MVTMRIAPILKFIVIIIIIINVLASLSERNRYGFAGLQASN